MKTYPGSCHCGAVKFELRLDKEIGSLLQCDCSICTKKGILHHPAEDDQLTVLSGESELSLYRFKSGDAKHWFCKHCGIHAFGRPRNNPERYTVNARCLDEFDEIFSHAKLIYFDGKNHPKDRTGA